ncbi:MAG: hypothetical protein IJD08_06515 [Oscillospiraceae bacterium]|nr:hypothetical protein [Oscillospiraceae bacterium]
MKKILIFILMFVFAISFSSCSVEVINPDDEKAAVVIIDGTEQEVSSSDIYNFFSRYEECKITVTDEVEKIGGPYIFPEQVPYYYAYQVFLKSGWCILVDENDDIMSTINIGDTIKAIGYVKDTEGWDVVVCGIYNDSDYGENWSSKGTKVSIVK